MFHQSVCLLLLALLNIMVSASPPFNGDSTARTKSTDTANHNQIFQNIYNNQHKLYRGTGSKQVHKRLERSKRGIALIDEDFNVKPDTRIKRDRNNKEVFYSKMNPTVKSTPMMMSEGSGSSETMSDELIPIRSFTTPDNVQQTRLLDQKAATSGNTSVRKSTRFAAPDNLQIPKLLGQEASAGADEDIEASGDGDSSTLIDTSRTTMDEDTSSKPSSPDTEGPDTTKITIDEDTSSKQASSSTEGPEVMTSTRYTTNKDTLPTHVVEVTESPTKDVHNNLCLNITCDSKDLIVLPNLSKAVPEGTNVTLSCSLPNATEQGLLKWYKYNSSDPFLLEENSNNHSVDFEITNTVLHNAGTYVCFKFTERLCCSKKLEITVYQVPNYKKHMIVIGGIAAASLLVCILIGICKCLKTKNYEKKIDLQNVEKPFLL